MAYEWSELSMKSWKLKNIAYLSIAVGMLVYAVPRLFIIQSLSSMQNVFSIVWLLVAILIIAAHLHELFGVDGETRKELDRIYKVRRRGQFQRSR